MRTSTITLISAFAVAALASPAWLVQRQTVFTCGSGDAKCCDVDVLGIADLDCTDPLTTPANATDFNNICAAEGKIDMCCDLNLLNQGLLCDSPTPTK